ncbi:3542_t:CDS:2, partial [Acaulospora colombiana]
MASSQPNTYKLFCIVEGESSPFPVEIQPDQTISALKDAIKLEMQPRFNDIAANELTLYKLNIPEDSNDSDDEHLEEKVNQQLTAEPAPKPLNPTFELLDIYPIDDPPAKRQVHIFVRVPGEQGGNSPRHNNIAKDLEPYIRFKLESAQSCSQADLLNNNIKFVETKSPPSYIIDFRDKLRRKRPAVAEQSNLLISDYFQFPSPTSDVQMTDSTQGTPDKVSYYDWIFLRDILRDPLSFGRNKEAHMYQLIHRLLDLQDARFGRDSIDVDGARSTDPRKYIPKSNASLCINRFPHLILEIISDSSQSDYYRMLLQAACLARLGNKLRKEKTNPFIVSAIYVDSQLVAKWCLVYQPNEMDNP